VAVVDTGVQIDHPDLRDAIWVNTDEVAGDGIDNDHNGYIDDRYGWDFASGDNNPADGNSHGTHVAGVIAAAHDGAGATGVAYAARILPVRVLDDSGSGSSTNVAQGIRYAVDNGADIINLSLGGGYSSDIFAAISYAERQDVLVVAASGNESAATPGYPARHSSALKNVISVGAFNSGSQIASFSNRVGNSQAVQIDAPGVSIFSTLVNDRHGVLSGTSMAAPHVAGVAALILSANPLLSSAALIAALTRGAEGSVEGSDSIGMVNAATSIPLALDGIEAAPTANGGGTLVGNSVGSIGRRSTDGPLGPASVMVRRSNDHDSAANFETNVSREVLASGQAIPSFGPIVESADAADESVSMATRADVYESVFADDDLLLEADGLVDALTRARSNPGSSLRAFATR
jgi:subtilisin family serine protease